MVSPQQLDHLTRSQTTNFRLFQTKRIADDTFAFDVNDRKFSLNVENVTSNFSFSHSVFKRLVLQTRKNKGLFWERVNSIPEGTSCDSSKLRVFSDDNFRYCLNRKDCLWRTLLRQWNRKES